MNVTFIRQRISLKSDVFYVLLNQFIMPPSLDAEYDDINNKNQKLKRFRKKASEEKKAQQQHQEQEEEDLGTCETMI
uniref:Uncharacterized protein n=1 Tax=Glossina pallidipes TaxID=7398 RepID=A0A1B0ABL4_GLOPL